MLDPDVRSFVLTSLPPAPARVLEVGAGAGELAHALTSAGYDVIAIDPASNAPAVRAVALHEMREPAGSFDAAVAVVSLHHVQPLVESCRRLGELLRSGSILVLDEFDVERVDEHAARWWLAHAQLSGDDHPTVPAEVVARLRHHCHGLGTLRAALAEWFELGALTRGPYLYRWQIGPGMRDTEEALIAAGRLPATGARVVGTRR
jgi:SAM-dependent methyltransferase